MRQILHIAALTAFLAGIIAPACGFAWGNNGGGKYSVIEICTANGYESRIVENDQEPSTPNHKMVDQCQFCFSSAHLTGFISDALSIEEFKTHALKLNYARYETSLLSRFTSHEEPRGPPALI